MMDIYDDCYQLPFHIKRYDANEKLKNSSSQPYDELFMWSLLLFSGDDDDLKLIKKFWSKSKYPLGCSLAAVIVYKSLIKENFVPEDIKDKMISLMKYIFIRKKQHIKKFNVKIFKREFEAMAVEVFKVCNERNQLIAQDLLICELDIFFNHSVLEMAITAEAYDFVCQVSVQQLLTDVWYDKISSHISIGQVFFSFYIELVKFGSKNNSNY